MKLRQLFLSKELCNMSIGRALRLCCCMRRITLRCCASTACSANASQHKPLQTRQPPIASEPKLSCKRAPPRHTCCLVIVSVFLLIKTVTRCSQPMRAGSSSSSSSSSNYLTSVADKSEIVRVTAERSSASAQHGAAAGGAANAPDSGDMSDSKYTTWLLR